MSDALPTPGGARRARVARVSRLAALLLAAAACGTPDHQLDLTALGAARRDGVLARVPVTGGEDGPPALLQTGETLELLVRVPPSARLRVENVAAAADSDLGVRVRADAGPVLEAAATPGAPLELDLAPLAGRVAALRFENGSGAPVRWRAPAILTDTPPGPPLLEPPVLPETRRPNVVLYVVDALRADRLSLYGYERRTSPNLEAFAARATVFERAYSPGPNTVSSVPALFTGAHPSRAMERLKRGAAPTTLAEALRRAGHATAAFQANFWLRRRVGFGRGFDTYALLSQGRRAVPAATLHEEALAWLDDAPRPFFLYLQSMDVHNPYRAPAPFRGRFAPPDAERTGADAEEVRYPPLSPRAYDEVVAYADHALGELLEALERRGLLDETIVVVTADHGEALGEGGRVLHGMSVNEEQIHVPLLVSVPGVAGGRRVRDVVGLADLPATLLDLADVRAPAPLAGGSWLEPARTRLAVGWGGPREFVRWGDWKLVSDAEAGELALYDLERDPAESTDRSGASPIVTRYLASQLWIRSPSFRDPGRRVTPPEQGLDARERGKLLEALRALGYAE